jgi:hypothetical protein
LEVRLNQNPDPKMARLAWEQRSEWDRDLSLEENELRVK